MVMTFLQLSGTQLISINYEKCVINSYNFEIGATEAIGVGVTKYDSSLQSAIVTLPSPTVRHYEYRQYPIHSLNISHILSKFFYCSKMV